MTSTVQHGELPAPISGLLDAIANGRGDTPALLAQFAAALIHPDYVCSLALLARLPAGARATVLDAFSYAIANELPATMQTSILTFVEPYMLAPIEALAATVARKQGT